MSCPICNTETIPSFNKPMITINKNNPDIKVISGIRYDICPNCQCCFTLDEIVPQTHNQGDKPRNLDSVNKIRLERINWYGPEKINTIIDFGCGNGQFVDFASTFYEEVIGIDQHTGIQLEMISSDRVEVINCVEVIEHLISPKEIVEEFYRVLRHDGIVYLESSFTDNLGELINSGYVNPDIGHILVHSRKSIEMLFDKFQATWINGNVVVFKKK